jgi:hypothetical protein
MNENKLPSPPQESATPQQERDTILHEFPMSKSRRYSTRQSKATKSFLFYALGIVVVLVVLGFVGFQLLINYSLLLDKIRGEEETAENTKQETNFLLAPTFDIPYSATNSSSLTFSGKSDKDTTVELFVNGKQVDDVRSDGEFRFRNIKLKDGENEIKVRAVKDKEKSSFSESVSIFYRENEPKLEVTNPNNGDSFSGGQSILKVTGVTEPYAKVTINGAWAIMDDEGNFSYNYQMQSGENTLLIKTEDDANNKVEKEVKFTYSP